MQMKSKFYSRSSEHRLTYALCKHREKWSYISVYINDNETTHSSMNVPWQSVFGATEWLKLSLRNQKKWSLRVRNNFSKFHRILGLMSLKVIKYLKVADTAFSRFTTSYNLAAIVCTYDWERYKKHGNNFCQLGKLTEENNAQLFL